MNILKHLSIASIISLIFIHIIATSQAQGSLQDLLSAPSCPSSCWLGIIPGITTDAELANILDTQGIVYQKASLGSEGTGFVYNITGGYTHPMIPANVPAFAGIIINSGIVAAIDIGLNGVSVNDLLFAYGAPAAVIDDSTISINLAYPTEGMIFTVRENIPDFIFGVRIVSEETVNRYIHARHLGGNYFPCSDGSQLCAVQTATPIPPLLEISSLSLINPATNSPIAGFDPIADNAVIDLATVTASPLSFRATTNPATVGSVVFSVDGQIVFTDDSAPYEYEWTPVVGEYTLTATPYSSAGASGIIGTPYTIHFTVSQSLSITSFSLIDSVTGLPIQGYAPIVANANNQIEIDLDALPNRNLLIRANTVPATVGSVYFSRVYYSPTGQGVPQGIWQETDNSAPYTYSFSSLGWYTLTARAFSGADKTGTAGTPYNLHLNLRDSRQERLNRILFRHNSHIYIMNADGTNPVDLGAGESPSFSPDGSRIAFQLNGVGGREIYVMNADGTNRIRLTNNNIDDRNPAWSPDGSRIVYCSVNTGADWELWIMNADGSNKVQITNNNTDDADPVWSSNNLIAFSALTSGYRQIYTILPDGSQRTLLTSDATNKMGPEWSPDGSMIVYNTSDTTNDDIYRINADGTNGLRLTSNASSDIDPEWSPNGSQIVFSSDRAGGTNRELYLMNADGSGETRFTFTPGINETAPAWGYP